MADVKYIKIKQRKSRAKFTFSDDSAFGSLFYDINHEPIAYSGNAIEFMSNKDDYVINYNQGEILLKVPAAAKYFKYTGYTANGNRDSLVLLRETVKERLQDSENKTDYTSYINQARFVSGSPSIQSLGLLHFSDIHEDTVAALKVNEWATKYKDYINDVICTGDVVLRYLNGTDAKTWWIEKDIASKSLFVLGNHDQTYNSDVNVRRSYFYADGGEQGDGNIDFTIAKSEAIKPTHIFAFNQYFANFIDGLGVNMPIGYDDPSSPYYQACYWHKDYAAQKVRLIGVDCIFRFDGILAKDSNGNFIIDKNTGMLTIADDGQGYAKLTTEQETWLYNKLNETLDSNNAAYDYSVVVVCHYPLDDCDGWNVLGTNGNRPNWSNVSENGGIVLNHKTGDTVNFHYGSGNSAFILDEIFNMRNRVQSGSTAYGYNKGLVNNMGDIIQKWQSNGGKFVAWVCGHTHVDKFYYPKKYPNILCAVIDQAGSLRDHNQEYRNQDDYSNNIANYLSVDTQNGLFKIVRFGLNKDKLLTAKNYLCYDYINKFVVNEG